MFLDRDAATFPALDAARLARRVPTLYGVRWGPHVTWITIDDFFVPEDVAGRLFDLYGRYIAWWVQSPARRWFPRDGVGNSDFSGPIYVVVLTEHAPWWIRLFDEAGPLTFNRWDRAMAAWLAKSDSPVS